VRSWAVPNNVIIAIKKVSKGRTEPKADTSFSSTEIARGVYSVDGKDLLIRVGPRILLKPPLALERMRLA
jgi:hypothetical protein